MINLARNKTIRIGIIDIFGKNNKGIPINSINPDFTHGEMVSSVLTNLTDEFNRTITQIPVQPRQNSANMAFDLASLLKNLKNINKFFKDFDFLNISGSFPIQYAAFGLDAKGAEFVCPQVRRNVFEKMKKITINDKNEPMSIVPVEVVKIISELERIIKDGTQVFISACNKKLSFNSFSLANGIHTIGGKNGKTGEPIQRFSHSALVEEYVNLPIYITQSKSVIAETDKMAVNLKDIKPTSFMAEIPRENLKIATEDDYELLQNIVEDLFAPKKFTFDIDFFRFKLINQCKKADENLPDKIFETDRFLDIFKGKLDDEVLKYTNPSGSTHCDLMFRQFFDMGNNVNHVIPLQQTTQVTNTLSGTSFAAPQGLFHSIKNMFGL